MGCRVASSHGASHAVYNPVLFFSHLVVHGEAVGYAVVDEEEDRVRVRGDEDVDGDVGVDGRERDGGEGRVAAAGGGGGGVAVHDLGERPTDVRLGGGVDVEQGVPRQHLCAAVLDVLYGLFHVHLGFEVDLELGVAGDGALLAEGEHGAVVAGVLAGQEEDGEHVVHEEQGGKGHAYDSGQMSPVGAREGGENVLNRHKGWLWW